jgi:hypothetical protein
MAKKSKKRRHRPAFAKIPAKDGNRPKAFKVALDATNHKYGRALNSQSKPDRWRFPCEDNDTHKHEESATDRPVLAPEISAREHVISSVFL